MSEPEIIDPTELDYSGNAGNELTPKGLAMAQLQRCIRVGSVEWHGGYEKEETTTTPSGIMITKRVHVPDTRETFTNSVMRLHDFLMPYFQEGRDHNYIEKFAEIVKEIKNQTVTEEKVLVAVALFQLLCSFMYDIGYLGVQDYED